eukprot:GFKZ01005340.1.p1 GENE.GFKZ01005340.1~~GFKZ01005340.1.p1  ORF type:complete len:103 (-),score=7.28 GFKZ01005340.1:542-850(-)
MPPEEAWPLVPNCKSREPYSYVEGAEDCPVTRDTIPLRLLSHEFDSRVGARIAREVNRQVWFSGQFLDAVSRHSVLKEVVKWTSLDDVQVGMDCVHVRVSRT